MFFFKKRVSIEDFATDLVRTGIPRAIHFFHEENQRARYHLNIGQEDLTNIGGGLCFFFLAPQLQNEKKADQKNLQRAARAIRRAIGRAGGNSDRAQDWWKTIEDDARIIHGQADPLDLACKAVWSRTYRDRPFKEHGALRSFAYFLQMEVNAAGKIKLV